MMISCTIIFATILSTVVSERGILSSEDDPTRSTFLGPVGFQIHSYNDLRQWRSLLYLKRSRFIKLDPHYVRSSIFCGLQERVIGDGPCMVLNHDDPTLLDVRYNYNTTDDVLDLIVDHREHFQNTSARTYFALCWKAIPLDHCSTKSSWVKLVDAFFDRANDIVKTYDLNIEFVLDSGVPNECHRNRWRPWVSTSTWDKTALFSNDETLGYDRYQVLNPSWKTLTSSNVSHLASGAPCGDFASCASVRYGKFANITSSHSWQVYEPANERDIQSVLKTFFDAKISHDPGLRFAINIDPAMFQVYSAGDDPTETRPIGRHQVFATNASSPFIAVLREDVALTILVVSPSRLLYHIGSVFESDRTFRSVPSTFVPTSLSVDNNLALLSDNDGHHALYSILDDDSLRLERTFNVNGAMSSRLIRGFGSARDDSIRLAILSTETNITSCDLVVRVVDISNLKSSTRSVGEDVCIQGGITASVQDMRIGWDIVAKNASSLLAIVTYSTESELYGASVTFRTDGSSIVNGVTSSTSASPRPHRIGVGRDSSVSIGIVDSRVDVLIVHDFGFCWNNEEQNKDAKRGVCDLQPSSTPNVLVYDFGSFKDFVAFFSEQPDENVITTCDPTIAHGTYDQGQHPAVSLFYDDDGQSPRLVELHEGITEDAKDEGNCGMPVPHPGGVVLDSWWVFAKMNSNVN